MSGCPRFFTATGGTFFSKFVGFYRVCRTSASSCEQVIGGEGGIRTHVPELPDHPISSRRRYDHFGTSPLT